MIFHYTGMLHRKSTIKKEFFAELEVKAPELAELFKIVYISKKGRWIHKYPKKWKTIWYKVGRELQFRLRIAKACPKCGRQIVTSELTKSERNTLKCKKCRGSIEDPECSRRIELLRYLNPDDLEFIDEGIDEEIISYIDPDLFE